MRFRFQLYETDVVTRARKIRCNCEPDFSISRSSWYMSRENGDTAEFTRYPMTGPGSARSWVFPEIS